jgi:zinc D-Ala-D-Ala carboxypeptidase
MMKQIVDIITKLLFSGKDRAFPVPVAKVPAAPKKASPLVSEKDGYFVWDKGVVAPLSPHFSTREMTCRCKINTCKEQRISKDLIARLEKVRQDLGEPMITTSAYRCTEYQAQLRAAGVNTVVAKKSTHELGNAVDVVPKSGMSDKFEPICAKYFKSIGLSTKFLHLDLRPGFKRWKY